MSSEELTVSFKLQSGELFDGIRLGNVEWTLAKFIDESLKKLENESRIQLPYMEGDLVDLETFKVFDGKRENQLDLTAKLGDLGYLASCRETGETPCFYLVSNIFMDPEQVEREERVNNVLRQQEGQPIHVEHEPPSIPERTSSIDAQVTSNDQLLYLAGRKPYEPHPLQRGGSPSTSSLMSEGNVLPGSVVGRMLEGSTASLTASEDSTSLHSATSLHRALTKQNSDSELNNQRDVPFAEAGDQIRRSASEKSRLSPSGKGLLRHTASMPPNPTVNITIEEDRVSCGGLSNITEGEELTGSDQSKRSSLASISRRSREREVSPGALERPTSPEGGVSPASSPRATRKKRLASKRQTKRTLFGDSKSSEGGASASTESESSVAVATETGGQALAPSSLSRRNMRRTIYAKSRVVASSFLPMRIFGNIKTFVVEFEIPIAEVSIQMEIRGDYSVGQIKDNLWNYMREQDLMMEEYGAIWDPENFTFTYKMNGEMYELYDEQQIFQTAKVVQFWRSEKIEKGLLCVELKKGESKEEKTLNMEISTMIGIGLYQLQFANNDELDITRRKMVTVRREAVKSRNPFQYSMEADITNQPIPKHVLESLHENKTLIRVYYKLSKTESTGSRNQFEKKTLQVDIHMTADELLTKVFPDTDMKKLRYGIPIDSVESSYVLKIAGQNSYIHGGYELMEFAYVIQCLIKKTNIDLALVVRVDPAIDKLRDIEDWNQIDEATGLTGTHSDLSALTKEHTQVFTLSMWDIQRKFRIRVVGVDNLTVSQDVVYVEAGIYHGGEFLGETLLTSEQPKSLHPRWNQWLVFDTTVKNLPKAARLCLKIVAGNRSVDTKRSKSLRGFKGLGKSSTMGGHVPDKPLHWINVQILDHRSLLRQGLLRLNMWPVVYDENGGSNMSTVGSTAVNPDGNNSSVLYIELDTYAHPVACPTGGWGDDTTITQSTPTKDSSKFRKDLERAIRADPLYELSSAERELIWKFRYHCTKIPEAMPKLLRSVNWADLEQVSEVHRLLKVWYPITMEVALELLDYHYADEKVRTLAVRRIAKISNSELKNFLLQLVQVLKFEPYHDSALARILLKKALQSKKIGHFFYWYLRSEMDLPEFNQRFGILLEAYLRGCGETMFRELQSQHKAVCDIMQVAATIKKQHEKSKGEVAKENLAKYQLPKSFSPPFNPTVTMGNLQIDKCKVMDSKKTPLWLEFRNMDPTVTDTMKPSIKVIAKHGDDLRQDMLTLQMLSVMDSMWQAHGLDLHIIPYGCIATGKSMGMIEVVQDAETVAKIQLHLGGTFSALKEEPLHDWLEKQNPNPSRFEAVVEKFMLSCAGYCVATYILGIGDRHNDNIMVTKSGNLFHIDFGHFLGNTKYFMGVNRERAPFVFTPDFEYVMGKRNSEMFKRFEDTAVEAYMIIRKNANVIINLFSMMKCTGIPELKSVEDLEYLRSVLVLEKSDQEAREHFKFQIQKCLKLQWSTQFNWLTHNIVHR